LDNYGFFALKHEVFNFKLDMVKKLLAVGADINNKDEFQRTVIHHVLNRYRPGNDLGLIKYLLAQNPDINIKDFK
jgi:ankyrin repeat protein